jgi:hypothetical protein
MEDEAEMKVAIYFRIPVNGAENFLRIESAFRRLSAIILPGRGCIQLPEWLE